jgi:hypothetical protein
VYVLALETEFFLLPATNTGSLKSKLWSSVTVLTVWV